MNAGRKAKKCVACHQFSPTQSDARPDLFSTTLLAELKAFKKYLESCSEDTPLPECSSPAKHLENENDGCDQLEAAKSLTSSDDEKEKTEKNVQGNSDDSEEEEWRIRKPASLTRHVGIVGLLAPASGNNVSSPFRPTTKELINRTETETDAIVQDSDKVETKKSPRPRKFFKRERQEKSKPQPQVNIRLPISKGPKKALPASKTRKGIRPKKEEVPMTPTNPSSSKKSSVSTITKSKVTVPVTPSSTTATATSVVSSPASVKRKNAKGETVLHVAARTGQVVKVKQLLKMAADINAQDFAGWTPLVSYTKSTPFAYSLAEFSKV